MILRTEPGSMGAGAVVGAVSNCVVTVHTYERTYSFVEWWCSYRNDTHIRVYHIDLPSLLHNLLYRCVRQAVNKSLTQLLSMNTDVCSVFLSHAFIFSVLIIITVEAFCTPCNYAELWMVGKLVVMVGCPRFKSRLGPCYFSLHPPTSLYNYYFSHFRRRWANPSAADGQNANSFISYVKTPKWFGSYQQFVVFIAASFTQYFRQPAFRGPVDLFVVYLTTISVAQTI
jgi:hypothetical protein